MSNLRAADAPRSPAAHVHDPVVEAELLGDLLLDREQLLLLVPRPVGVAVAEELELVELVHAEDPARVLAARAGLAPEARREADVVQRQVVGREHLAAVQRRQRHLGGADQVSSSVASAYTWASASGKNPVPTIASRLTSTGGITGMKPRACSLARPHCTSANSSRTRSPSR